MSRRQTTHSELVWDRIPEIIEPRGSRCREEVLSPEACRLALLDKLIEEAREPQAAPREHLAADLVDSLEVVGALVVALGLNCSDMLVLQEQRRGERGGFGDRAWLLWTE